MARNPTNADILKELREFKQEFYTYVGFMRGVKWAIGIGIALLAIIKGKGSFSDLANAWAVQ